MDPITAANILPWCLLALAFTCVITLVGCAAHEQFVDRSRRKRQANRTVTLVPLPTQKPDRSAAQRLVVRGYDSPELWREDLWLLRLERSRKDIAALNGAAPRLEERIGTRQFHGWRVSAMLAHCSGVRCDN
ncbi:MAG TPA: hypothetical protein VFU31_00925 [Candidatus Binatia bacterium]|nr:hypothetical protein [Candidatus Binatia bacterium]